MYRCCDRLWRRLTPESVIFQWVFFIFSKPESGEYGFIMVDSRCAKAKHSFEFLSGILLCQLAWAMR
jgi:hypothetical protein